MKKIIWYVIYLLKVNYTSYNYMLFKSTCILLFVGKYKPKQLYSTVFIDQNNLE